MLILGAPGAGKTTLLLDLARNLSEQAHADENKPIPVLIDLAGWTAQPSPSNDDDPLDSPYLAGFVRWLLIELNTRYGIPPAVGRTWLRRGRLALLLDGLDEIAEPTPRQARTRAGGAPPPLPRRHDRSDLPDPGLRAPTQPTAACTALCTSDHSPDNRSSTTSTPSDPKLDGARAAIEQDDEVWDLVNSPLMLNVMILAYQGRAPEEVVAGGVADLRRELFDTYISEVLSRDRMSNRQYDSRTAVRRLWCLAWWTRQRAGDRTAVPRWLIPNGWHGLSAARGGLPRPRGLPTRTVRRPRCRGDTRCSRAVRRTGRSGCGRVSTAAGAPAAAPVAGAHHDGSKPQWAPLLALTFVAGTATTLVLVVAVMGLVELLPVGLALDHRGPGDRSVVRLELIVFHDNRRRLLLAVRLTVVVVGGWLALSLGNAPGSFATGLAVGLMVAQGIRMVKSLPTDHLVLPSTGQVGGWIRG